MKPNVGADRSPPSNCSIQWIHGENHTYFQDFDALTVKIVKNTSDQSAQGAQPFVKDVICEVFQE